MNAEAVTASNRYDIAIHISVSDRAMLWRAAAAYALTFSECDDIDIEDMLGLMEDPFEVQRWRVWTGDEVNEAGEDSEAIVKVSAKGRTQALAGEGQGPLNALDQALRSALTVPYPPVESFELVDYRVRILDQGHGTDAIVRALLDMTDGTRTWTTVGVGTNVIEASWEALMDAYRWGLIER